MHPEMFKYEWINISKVELNGITKFPSTIIGLITIAKPSSSCCWIVGPKLVGGCGLGIIPGPKLVGGCGLGIIPGPKLIGGCVGEIGGVIVKQGKRQVEFHVAFNKSQLHNPSSTQEKLFGTNSHPDPEDNCKENPIGKQVILFVCNCKVVSLSKLLMVDGIVPLNRLSLNTKASSRDSKPMVDGIVPLNWLSLNSKTSSCPNIPMVDGIVPFNW